MSGLSGLYQELIMDHAQSPRHRGDTGGWARKSHQLNPVCGDEVTVAVEEHDGAITELVWEGSGCAISQSSASLLAELVQGRARPDVDALIAEFREALRSRGQIELDEERFGDAVALNGVSKYVARVKCAMLPWVALEAALQQ